ncbi:alpha-1-inhibitor 3-like [Leptodactylus fuscus]|uniref:alpha-1-inhibitor 3-like n=1 Tax=Leptodactylus fuscus TaxID=238119 RepID=UPI003F4E9401
MWLLLMSTCLAIFCPSLTSASEPHYMIAIPYTLAQGAKEKACVTFLDLKGAVDLKLELKIDDQVHTIGEHKIDAHDHSECYPFQVPVINKVSAKGSVHVTAHGDHIHVDKSRDVIITKQELCIIHTDKYVYKPDDTVMFQFISMDRDYRSTDTTYRLVEIIDPNKHRIAQWRDVSTKDGFGELSFHLADELPLGEYQITLTHLCKAKFKVEEYVSKRFKVNINEPSSVSIDKTLHLDICGRYTYGKPVQGSFDLSICPEQNYHRKRRDSPDTSSEGEDEDNCIIMKEVKTDSTGCLSKDINLEFFNFSKSVRYPFVEIKASLTEEQTGHIEKASVKVYISTKDLIRILDETIVYQKGLPYYNKLKVIDIKGQPIPNKTVYIYVLDHNGEFSGKPQKTVVTEENGIALFALNTSTWESYVTIMPTFSSEYDDDDHYYSLRATIAPLYTQSQSQLVIRSHSSELECDSDQTMTVEYNIDRRTLDSDTDHLHFFYMVRSKTGISLYKEHKIDIKDQPNNPTIRGLFPMSFHVDADLFPFAMLIVFSILPNGETIGNLVPYEIPFCVKDKVEIKFSEEQVHPGTSVNLEVSARAGSLCSIRSVDKAHSLRISGVSSLYSDLTSSLNIFTNTQIKKPETCVPSGLSARSGSKGKKSGDKDKKRMAPFIRRHFPDRWIFDLVHIPPEGHTVLNLTTPHSVTKWVTDAFCLGKTGFASVSNVELTTFQPYFIDLIVPYSVVQGERFTIQALVFNYETECILIVVSLSESEDLAGVKNNVQAKCVCEGHSHSFTWDVTAIKPKTLQIHVDSSSLEVDGKCTEDSTLIENIHKKDSVEKTIMVKPRGHEEEQTQTFLLYPGDTEEVHIALTLPKNLVSGSERAHVFILGDIMAKVSINLENLVHLPEGCGEQKASKMLRYGYTLEYLENVDEVTPEQKATIVKALANGYQNQLTYRTESGGFGFFPGESLPHLWITVLIVKAFTAAQNWIHIDKNYIQEAVNWLQTVQKSDGCFGDEGYYFNNELEANNDVARTAFVLIAFLEHQREYNGSMVEDGLGCLRRSVDTVSAAHTQALLAYTFTLSGDHELRDHVLKKLDEKAIKKDGTKHWETNPNHRNELETPSYILLALLSDKTTASKHMEECADIVRWIVSFQNSDGGFQSSQDSTLALQALAKYAKVIDYKKGDTTVTIRSKSGFYKTVDVHRNNSLLVQKVDLPENPGEYDISVKGDGMAFVQVHSHYNVYPDESATGHFSVNVTTEPSICTHESRRKFDVHIDVRYSGNREKTNMVVILTEPISGYVPDKNSIKKLKENPAVSRTEVSAEKITLYLDKLTHEMESFQFTLEQEINVENLQPASVVISDYYHPDVRAVVEYDAPCHGGLKQAENH